MFSDEKSGLFLFCELGVPPFFALNVRSGVHGFSTPIRPQGSLHTGLRAFKAKKGGTPNSQNKKKNGFTLSETEVAIRMIFSRDGLVG